MGCHMCSIVPPYLLSSIAENHKEQPVGQAAASTLAFVRDIHEARKQCFQAKLAQLHSSHGASGPAALSDQSIVPHYLLDQISNAEGVDDAVKESARNTLALSRQAHDARPAATDKAGTSGSAVPIWRGVYNMDNQTDRDAQGNQLLPGEAMRVEGQPPSADKAVNEAYDNCGKVLEFYKKVFNYDSLDNHGMPVISSVHFGTRYGNAGWSKDYQQMIYGDGDDKFLYNFTACLDVIGHEMTVSPGNYV